MSEQEKKSTVNAGPSMVVIEQASEMGHKQPYRPTELGTPDSELHHKRSKAPAVPAIADELKVSEESNNDNETLKDKTESEPLSSEIYKPVVVKKISSIPHKLPSSPEIIALESVISSTNPMPPSIAPAAPTIDDEKSQNKIVKEKKSDEDSITDEVAELPAADTATVHSEWSDDEEAGGLPRNDSRASRVSRAVRQLFCCGVPYEAPSEDNLSIGYGYACGI